MGLVPTPEELERTTAALARPRFEGGVSLAATYRTDRSALTALLPPPLAAPEDPLVHVGVSSFPHATCGPYTGGTVRVAATLDGAPCRYVVAMYMDTDDALLFGRELFGEPKKLAHVELDVAADHATATVTRGGTALLHLDATLGTDDGGGQGEHLDVNLKGSLAHDGAGLEADATLLTARMQARWIARRVGRGAVTVGSTPHDPLGDLPVRDVVSLVTLDGLDISATLHRHGSIDASVAWPFVAGRLPHWATLADR